MNIRLATHEDLPAIMAIHDRQTEKLPWVNRWGLADWDASCVKIVAVDDKGEVVMLLAAEPIYELGLVCDPDTLGNADTVRLGQRMYAKMAAILRRTGARCVVSRAPHKAKRYINTLMKRFGFTKEPQSVLMGRLDQLEERAKLVRTQIN